MTLAILTSCNFEDRKNEVYITDKDYVENYKQYSPDSSMILINYSLDLGAFGYRPEGTAIIKITDTTCNLRDFTLPNTFTNLRWLDSLHISSQIDNLASLRSGEKTEFKNEEINNVEIIVSGLDYIDSLDHLKIEHREISPNGKFELIAYRYVRARSKFDFIHISVIPVGGQIPKFGNYLIADNKSDYVFNGIWTKSNELEFYSNSEYSDLVPYFLVQNRPKINYKIVIDDKKYGSKNRWT